MAREIPEVVRAAAGLAATVLDEARKLPETLPGLPVRVIGVAMQHAMKVQQTYAGLIARGDELLTGLRGESEPGLATFDEDLEPSNGFRDSAFDRVTDEDVASVLAAADEAGVDVDDAVVDSADGVASAERSIEVTEDAPSTEEVLDELAIDEAVPVVADTDPLAATGGEDAAVTEDADALESALLESDTATTTDTTAAAEADPTADVATTVDILTPDGEVETVEAAVTDEGVAAVEAPQDEPGTDETVATTDAAAGADEPAGTDSPDTETVAVDESGSPVAAATDDAPATEDAPADDADTRSQAPATAPIDGYDDFSIAQLRGRLRGYALSTVADLLAYEQANRAREPYLRMLRNRLEKLEEQAVEASPLAPRGL
ncbi:lipid droplet-associated protein [Blastococcus atacamensis]|uniref:lipid droplet-associated protein n=1 Tax=Blastococcus atacamensis TaxID=2070508 RepID=UPI000CEBFB34|nr:lipid droplet-associated protein [Blastococcus atacamensis]